MPRKNQALPPRKNQALPLAGILLMGCFAAHAFVGTPVQSHCRKSVASCHRRASHLQHHPPSVPRILSLLGRANEDVTQHVAVGLKQHRMLLRGGRLLAGGTPLFAKQGRADEEGEEEEKEDQEGAGLEGVTKSVEREELAERKETDDGGGGDDDDDDDDDDEMEIVRLQLAILMVKDRCPNPGLPSIGFDFSYLMINQNIEGEVCF